jgi:hypothetical protein
MSAVIQVQYTLNYKVLCFNKLTTIDQFLKSSGIKTKKNRSASIYVEIHMKAQTRRTTTLLNVVYYDTECGIIV